LARELVKHVGKDLEKDNFVPSITEFTKMRNYLIFCIALSSAHRSGVSANMIMEEFGKHVFNSGNNLYQIPVRRHKTFRKHGHAIVCMLVQQFNYLKVFVEHVRSTFQVPKTLFFRGNGKQPPKKNVSATVSGDVWG